MQNFTPKPPPAPPARLPDGNVVQARWASLTTEAKLEQVAALLSLVNKRVSALTERVDELHSAGIAARESARNDIEALQGQAVALDRVVSAARSWVSEAQADFSSLQRYQSKQGREIADMQRRLADSSSLLNTLLSALRPALPWLAALTRAIEDSQAPYDVDRERRAIDRIGPSRNDTIR